MNRNGIRSRMIVLFVGILLVCCTACGGETAASKGPEGSLEDIMTALYANADLDADFREGLEYFEMLELTDDLESYILGTDEITYTEGVVSIPAMSSVAYQCVLLRVDEADVETAKEALKSSADPNKWVCVSAETTLIESRGDVIFFIMSSKDVAYAMNSAFQNL